jgi:RNA polymerase sigma-70 factor (ECF subfamily)
MTLITPTVLRSLRFYAMSITKEAGAAELLVDDAITKCAERTDLSRIRPGKLLAYLKMILKNKALDWLRRWKRQRTYYELHHDGADRGAFAEVICREAMEFFDRCVLKLPKEYRKAIILKVVHKLTNEQIAKRLKVPRGTIMSRLFRARKIMRQLYEGAG